jgi:hypothetical protein
MGYEGDSFADSVQDRLTKREQIREDVKRRVAALWEEYTPDSYTEITENGVNFGWRDYRGDKAATEERFRKHWEVFISQLDVPMREAARELMETR